MAAMHGSSEHLPQDSPFATTNHLGKRKRSSEKSAEHESGQRTDRYDGPLQDSMRATLQLLKNYDPSPSLLKYPLTSIDSDEPNLKRARLAGTEQENDSIEIRVMDGVYGSYDAFMKDVNRVSSLILDQGHGLVNTDGEVETGTRVHPKARAQIATIRDTLARVRERQEAALNGESAGDDEERDSRPSDHEKQQPGQVLTLRSQTERGPRQLFTGLQRSVRESMDDHDSYGVAENFAPLDLRKLPNGFELVDPALPDAQPKRRDFRPNRTVGEVFRPRSSLKPLELPRSGRTNVRGALLGFISPADAQFALNSTPVLKNDYKYSPLPTGQWLHYKDTESSSPLSPDLRRKLQDRSHSFDEGRVSSDITEEIQVKSKARFQSVYSSFAPAYDNSSAVISESTRNHLWWSKFGERRFRTLFTRPHAEDNVNGRFEPPTQDADFEEAVHSFETEGAPTDHMEALERNNEPSTTDEVLQEVSELLETLSSHQRLRSVEAVQHTGNTPALPQAEQEMYELLRSQLQILVSSLPPFAVAKLNGDQLEELSITTTMLRNGPDYPGTGEPDDYTLQRRNASRAATAATNRTTSSVPGANRPTYPTPSGTTYSQRPNQYGAQNSYGRAAPSQSYQTPRPPSATAQRSAYPQATYASSTTPYTNHPSLQAFQRPVQNGYAYGANASTVANYAQTPSQPGYAQRAQDSAAYARSASPQKSMTNGQVAHGYGQQTRLHQTGPYTPSTQYTSFDQKAAIEGMKVAQQQAGELLRSGTPQTPGGHGRYDGVDERNGTPGSEVKVERSASIAESGR